MLYMGGVILGDNIIFSNDYFSLLSLADGVFIETFKKGFPVNQLSDVLLSHPEIDIQNFIALRNALNTAPHPQEKIGQLKEKIVIELVENDLQAYIIYNLPKEDLDLLKRENLIRLTSSKLNEKGILTGINRALFLEEIRSGKSYLIAQGIQPINGNDSIIKMYQLEESKPELHEDGTVDFYELKLINRVKAGDWLGERIDATDGKPGTSVIGSPIKATNGKTLPLSYDKSTIMEVYENQKTTLYSRVNGAVNFTDGKISVSNHLEIDGDVDFKTGNIKFDGFVSIKGSVTDGFFVQATKDIEINSILGLGNVKGILSTQGSIFIKGGIASKGGVEIKAEKNIFTKFVDNATLTCGGTAHIGFYCINSIVNAGEVIVEASNGKIIGGSITAKIKVVSPTIGSEIEKKTTVEILGFNRTALKDELDSVFHEISELKNEQQKVKINQSHLENLGELNPFQRKEFNEGVERLISIKIETKELEERRKSIADFLKTRGEGEINVTKKLFPNCILIIKNNKLEINAVTPPTAYYFQDGQLKQTN
jgi:uncharacterized protein